ncbi:MAG: hypothetical protein AB1489_31305 [Acidobacteriota bacterium]
MSRLLTVENLVFLAGLGQLLLALGSIYIPYVLKWREELVKLRPLTRQVFWTYAAYILCINLSFGLLSTLGTKLITDRSSLAAVVTGFITAYWATRVMIQFFYFDRSAAPQGRRFILAEIALNTLFIFFTIVYGYTTYFNIYGCCQ